MLITAIIALLVAPVMTAPSEVSRDDGPSLPELGSSKPKPSDRYVVRVVYAERLYIECAANVAARIREEKGTAYTANLRAVMECQHELIAVERAQRLFAGADGAANEAEVQRALDSVQVERWETIQSFFLNS